MGTIVQEYGPYYGEPVNGTVQGRPNGSVYVPITNTITVKLVEASRYIIKSNDVNCSICASNGTTPTSSALKINANAVAQDLASNIEIVVYEDSDCLIPMAKQVAAAGNFNPIYRTLKFVTEGYDIVDEASYYLRAELYNNSTRIAISDVITIEGVVTE